MKGASLQHKIRQAVIVCTDHLTNLSGNLIIFIPRKIKTIYKTSPRIKPPVTAPQQAFFVHHKSRPHIPHPCIIAGHLHHLNIGRQLLSGVLILISIHTHCHRHKSTDRLCHLCIRLLCRLCPIPPVVRSLWPKHPDTFLRFKFCRHMKTISRRG